MAISTSRELTSAISGGNILLRDLLGMAFRIPNYQRPYKWERDQIEGLLNDIEEARAADPDGFYYLGTLVLVETKEVGRLPNPGPGISAPQTTAEFVTYEVLDGQQRLTTLGIILAVLRDMGVHSGGNWLYHDGDYLQRIPPHSLLDYAVRPAASIFWNTYIQPHGEILPNLMGLISSHIMAGRNSNETSVANIAKAVEIVFGHITDELVEDRKFELYSYLLRNTYVSCIATESLSAAFRMFKVLNARGMPLTEPDIIKADNLGRVQAGTLQDAYAIKWQDWQDDLKENFDNIFYMLRNIELRRRSQSSLLTDWESHVSRHKSLGESQLNYIFENCDLYLQLFVDKSRGGDLLNNLIVAFNTGFMTDAWKDPLLMVFLKFPTVDTTNFTELIQFTERLYKKILADWILETPAVRAGNVFKVLEEISSCNSAVSLSSLPSLSYNVPFAQIWS